MQPEKNTDSTGKKNLLPKDTQTWLGRLDEDGDKILVRRAYIDLCEGDPYAALIFSQLMYYYLPDKRGRSKLRVNKGGYWWVAKRYEDWMEECRVKPSTAKKKIDQLEKAGLVVTRSARFNGLKILHLRIDFDQVEVRRQTLSARQTAGRKRPARSDGGLGPNGSHRSDIPSSNGRTQSDESSTESTAEITPENEDPLAPCAGRGNQPFVSGNEDTGIPEGGLSTVGPGAAGVAADAAPPGSASKALATPAEAALPNPRSPAFPKSSGQPNWVEGVRRFDHHDALLLSGLFPGQSSVLEDQKLARKYYNSRYRNNLTSGHVRLLARWYPDCHLEDCPAPSCLSDLLDTDVLQPVLRACCEEVRQELRNIRLSGETDDGPTWTHQQLKDAGRLIDQETDILDRLKWQKRNYVGVLSAGYVKGAKRITEAHQAFREEIIDDLGRWPSWIDTISFLAPCFPEFLGMTLEEIKGHQRKYSEEKDLRIAELRGYFPDPQGSRAVEPES